MNSIRPSSTPCGGATVKAREQEQGEGERILRRARQLVAVWTRRMQLHMDACTTPARRCRSCVALYNRVLGMEAALRVLEDGDWGR